MAAIPAERLETAKPASAACVPAAPCGGTEHRARSAGDQRARTERLDDLRPDFEHQVERGLSRTAEAGEPGLLADRPKPDLARLRAEGEADFLAQRRRG